MVKNRSHVLLLSAALLCVGITVGVLLTRAMPAGAATAAVQQQDWSTELAALDQRIAELPPLQQAFVLVSRRVTPAVVTVSSERIVRGPDFRMQIPEEFRRFFDDDFFFGGPQGGERRMPGLGSGVIVDPDGIILTNNHVVAQADSIQVTLADNRTLDAEVVGTDPDSDLAVLRVEASGLPTVHFGDSEAIEVGEWVLAVGNPFSESLRHTVTAGIISAKGRQNVGLGTTYQNFIQTDAAINPGNSGGALVNLRGELIGINTAIATRSGTFQGVGFAIPVNMARRIMESLQRHGRVLHGWLGVQVQAVDENMADALGLERPTGALVADVLADTPAARAGLRRGDLVLELDGQTVDSSQDLVNRVGMSAPGTDVVLTVLRDGRRHEITVRLGERGETADAGSGSQEPSGEAEGTLQSIGLRVAELSPGLAQRYGYEGREGVIVSSVLNGGPAQRAGLQPGDLIQEINRRAITSVAEFNTAVAALRPGESALFWVRRGENAAYVPVRVPE